MMPSDPAQCLAHLIAAIRRWLPSARILTTAAMRNLGLPYHLALDTNSFTVAAAEGGVLLHCGMKCATAAG